MVYEWRAPSDDVAIALSSDEFFERQGTSLTGSFVNLEELAKRVSDGELLESWSTSIADFLFTECGIRAKNRLL